MAEENRPVLTESGMKELQEKLDFLIGTRRNEVAQQIEVARSYGDLSENAEYDEAKKEQGMLEAEISRIQTLMRNAVIISDDAISTETVSVGVTVTVFAEDLQESETYSIVGTDEVDPDQNKISTESAIGKALVGHRKGERIEVDAPGGSFYLRIDAISNPNGRARAAEVRPKAQAKRADPVFTAVADAAAAKGMALKMTSGSNTAVFSLVDSKDRDPDNNMISIRTRFGKAMMGKKQGDIVPASESGEAVDWTVEAVGTCKA